MRDRRTVDELSIEELEEILRLRRREARLERLRQQGKEVPNDVRPPASAAPVPRAPRRPGAPPTRFSAVIESKPKRPAKRGGIQWHWIWDRFLLFIEFLAVLGLLLIMGQLLLTMRKINEESRTLQAAPTSTPTPVIDVVVLPGGHTPPDAPGGAQPQPVPAHLKALVEEVTPLPVPTPGPEQARRIVIPALGVDAPVVEGDDWESLKKGAGHHIGSANPGERGNCVISAHNDIYGEIFRDLPELKVGDEIAVHTQTQVYRYVVQQTRIIEPTEVEVMAPTSTPVLTLISCYPYGVNSHRIVVIASLEF
ncbi:MAG: sortase [Anaerolineae bacterium]